MFMYIPPGFACGLQHCKAAIAHNKKLGEEEYMYVTQVVAVVIPESPACTINRASCYMPAHMAFLSKCEIMLYFYSKRA